MTFKVKYQGHSAYSLKLLYLENYESWGVDFDLHSNN